MKKRHLLWLVVIPLAFGVLITFVFGFYPLDSTKVPKISFDERVYDFGVVSREDLPHHRFIFSNTGQADLVISEVDSSCGCTAALLSAETIPPGGRGEIDVSFNPQGRRGKQKQTVSVYSNAENEPIAQLTVKGTVMAAVDVSPDKVLFGSVNNQEATTKRIRVLDSGEGTLKITHIETSSPFLTTEVGPVHLGKVINYELKVTLQPGVPVGKLQETLTIYTNSELQTCLSVSIEGNVLGPITVHPEHLFFGFVNRQEVAQRDILIAKTDGADLKVLEVGHQSQFISTKIVPLESGRKAQIQVTISGDTPSGPFRDLLEIYTNNTEQPVIQVPLHALVRE